MGTMGYRILVVDDHDDTTRVLSRLLRMKGHEVLTASTVAEAIGLCRTIRFDLMIADVDLPDGNGNDVMRALRPLGIRGVAFSGLSLPEDTRRAYDAGFKHFITKPVPDVLGVVDRLLAEPSTTVDAVARAAFFRAVDQRVADATRDGAKQQQPAAADRPDRKGFRLTALSFLATFLS
jgi:CheY-like chemotaxis protein